MPRAVLPSGIEIEYETFGDTDDPTLLLVCGYTSQLNGWDAGLCAQFVDQGLHVVRYDNRDVGLSTKVSGSVRPHQVLSAISAGEPAPDVPYTLSEMAADGIGLLDHLGVQRAHVAGVSMGGMIVQTMAIEHPDRLLSMTSIMSTVGDFEYGQPSPEALTVLLTPPPAEREMVIERAEAFGVWSSTKYFDAELTKQFAAMSYDRSFYPEGAPRQIAAMAGSGDRSDALRRVTTPTLVIHGRDDTLIAPSGGRRTAELVPGAHLLEVSDMGHDLPAQLWPLLTAAIVAHGRTVEHSAPEVLS